MRIDDDDDMGVLLQTSDMLDAFLQEMAMLGSGETTVPTPRCLRGQGAAIPAPVVPANGKRIKQEQEPPLKVGLKGTHVKRSSGVTPPSHSSSFSSSCSKRKRKHESKSDVLLSLLKAQNRESDRHPPVRRRRQKEELLQLREQALDLEKQLLRVKSTLAVSDAGSQLNARALDVERWECQARQEKKAKKTTEQENNRLKQIVGKELKLSNTIEKMLLKCYSNSIVLSPYERTYLPMDDLHDIHLFDLLERNADARFRELEKSCFAIAMSSPTDGHESHIVLNGNQETAVEFKGVQLFPFDMESIEDVSWKCIGRDDEMKRLGTGKIVKETPNTIAIQAKFTIQRETEEDIELEGHHVFKRSITKHRHTLTWEGVTQWKYANADDTQRLCMSTRETGWSIVQPFPGSGKAVPVSHVQFCMSTAPTTAMTTATGSPRRSLREPNLLRDLIIPSMEQLLVSHQQIAENMLMDASLARIRKGSC